jgi:hypothetical protein
VCVRSSESANLEHVLHNVKDRPVICQEILFHLVCGIADAVDIFESLENWRKVLSCTLASWEFLAHLANHGLDIGDDGVPLACLGVFDELHHRLLCQNRLRKASLDVLSFADEAFNESFQEDLAGGALTEGSLVICGDHNVANDGVALGLGSCLDSVALIGASAICQCSLSSLGILHICAIKV